MSSPATEIGDRVRLVRHNDKYSRLEPGTLGTVRFIDAMDTVHVKWDNGSTLGLIPGEDEYEVLYHDQMEE